MGENDGDDAHAIAPHQEGMPSGTTNPSPSDEGGNEATSTAAATTAAVAAGKGGEAGSDGGGNAFAEPSSPPETKPPLHDRMLPAVFPCVRNYGDTIFRRCDGGRLGPMPAIPLKKATTYKNDEIFSHLKMLPKRSKERAVAVDAVIKSGNATIGRTKIYKCLKKAEQDETGVADAETISTSKTPTDIITLGIGYEGCHIAHTLVPKRVTWRKSIVLHLRPIRFCETNRSKYGFERKSKFDSKAYLGFHVDPSLHGVVKEVLRSEVGELMPIDICQLIGNSDTVEKIPDGTSSEEKQKMWRCTHFTAFRDVCKKYNLPQLHFNVKRYKIKELRINKLYFSSQYPSPKYVQNEEASKIVWNRLKQYIEYMSELGGSPVICVGGSNANEKRFKCKASYRHRKGDKEHYPLCTFNFTVKWDDYGYYIPLLNQSNRDYNNGCAWHSCVEPDM